MRPLVSIITPAYNAAPYLPETVESVLQQTYPHWELIIIDDGSTDNTREIAERLVNADPRIRYIYQPNGKQGKARNNGISHASGSFIAFLDADDLWLPHKLAVQTALLQERPEVAMVFSDAYIFSGSPLTGKEKTIGIQGATYAKEEGLVAFLKKNRVPVLTALVRKSAIDRVQGFNESGAIQNAEDYMLWCELLLNDAVLVSVPEVLAAYRKHGQSVTASSDGSAIKQVLEVQNLLMEKYPGSRSTIVPHLKKMLVTSLSTIAKEPDHQYFDSLKRVFEIGGLKNYLALHSFCSFLGLRGLDLRMAYFLINRMDG